MFDSQIGNADEVTTQGVEFDVSYLINEHWDAALRGAYSDPILEDWDQNDHY